MGMYAPDNTAETTLNPGFSGDFLYLIQSMGNVGLLIFHDAVAQDGHVWGRKKTCLWPGARQASENAQAVSHRSPKNAVHRWSPWGGF